MVETQNQNPEEVTKRRLLEKISRECGSLVREALKDDSVIEIMLNPDGKLWVDRLGVGMIDTGHTMDPIIAESMLSTCASMIHSTFTYDKPVLEGEFPLDGSRFEAITYPVVPQVIFAIRKKAASVFTLEQYAEAGIICPASKISSRPPHIDEQSFLDGFSHPVDAIKAAIRLKNNLLVVGGTSSGKTTLANGILHAMSELCPNDRVIAIEDTVELQVKMKNTVLLRANENVSMQSLLRATMRLRPDRIVVGEVRGAETATLLKSWNSGHPGGIATIHADSAMKGLHKMVEYAMEIQNPPPHEVVCRRVAEAVNLVLFLQKINDAPGRLVSEISKVVGFENGKFILQPIKEK